ncbi:hypothetical protein ACLOJK_021960 [Asimina triloba]
MAAPSPDAPQARDGTSSIIQPRPPIASGLPFSRTDQQRLKQWPLTINSIQPVARNPDRPSPSTAPASQKNPPAAIRPNSNPNGNPQIQTHSDPPSDQSW